jgi:hypothetical protein
LGLRWLYRTQVKSGKSAMGMLSYLGLTAPLPVLSLILPPLSGLRGLRCVIIGRDERQGWCVNITYAQLRHVVMLPSSAPHHEDGGRQRQRVTRAGYASVTKPNRVTLGAEVL